MSAQKISKIFIQTKLEENEIEHDLSPLDILRKGDEDQRNYRFRKDVHFCSYKTTLESGTKAVIMVFSIKLPNVTTGSSAASEAVMNIIEILEDVLMPIADYNFQRNIDGINKNIALLRIVKEIE